MSEADKRHSGSSELPTPGSVKPETGARHPGGVAGKVLLSVAFLWSLFQLYISSAVPYFLAEELGINLVFNNQESRQIHLAFALVLVSLAFPLGDKSPRDRVPLSDWALAAVGAGTCLYLLAFKENIANRAGLPTTSDLIVSTVGMASLGVAVYRALGLPLLIVASVFIFYVFFGHLQIMPDIIQWKGASFGKAMWHYWMQTEGVFGVALGVSASVIFLFVLFGALLEKAGAGAYFIRAAFALLGHMRGGPAKAAVAASAMSGLYSGSSIANVVTTGTFTIPLMKKTGLPPEKAGAVEVASSTNGQLTPPVMGAAAFLISEFTGVSYPDIVRHAFLPAVVSYIALVYIVHLEAVKLGLRGLPRAGPAMPLARKLSGFLLGFILMTLLAGAIYFGLGWIKDAAPGAGFWSAAALFLLAYGWLIRLAAARPDLPEDMETMTTLPRIGDVAPAGLHFLLPIVILIWCVMVERLSPSLSAFWAAAAMTFILFTQRPLKAILRGERDPARIRAAAKAGGCDFVSGMISGARNMIGIGAATAVAGIIIGSVSLTGAHQVVGEFVEFLSGGSVMLMLIFVAIMSLLLGMGLPTTANYIVVSSLMAPVIVAVGAQSGLIVPLVAVHLFVFYFGILADDTPPVGLAAFAAAAISGGDPIRTGVQGFMYDIRTALLPFLFIFNTELLLMNVGPARAVFVFLVATAAMMLFAAATQGRFISRNKWWETIMLLLISFTLFRPGFWLDQTHPPHSHLPGSEIAQVIESLPEGESLRLILRGPDLDNPDIMTERALVLQLPPEGGELERAAAAGLEITTADDGRALVEEPLAGTPLFEPLQLFDFYGDAPVEVAVAMLPNERPPKEIFYPPALALLALLIFMQRRRNRNEDPPVAAAGNG